MRYFCCCFLSAIPGGEITIRNTTSHHHNKGRGLRVYVAFTPSRNAGGGMSVIQKVLKQKCTYWPPLSFDAYGQPTYGAAVELSCRWVGDSEEIITADGSTVVSEAEVMVESDVALKGALLFSALADVVDILNPLQNPGAHEIIKFEKIPNFKATENLRVAYV